MRVILNILWLVLAGFWLAVSYALAGLICCVLIITIPWGIGAFRMANYTLWPFGRTVVPRRDAGSFSFLGNIVWFVVAGWWLALGHILTGLLLCLTIIGLPLGVANFKLVPVSLAPLGREIVST